MRFAVLSFLLRLLSALKGVLAVNGNAITSPSVETTIHAGQIMELTWLEPVGAFVDLALMEGDPEDLRSARDIAGHVANVGTHPWKVPEDVKAGRYSIRITADTGDVNYSPWFRIFDPVTTIKRASSSKRRKRWGLF